MTPVVNDANCIHTLHIINCHFISSLLISQYLFPAGATFLSVKNINEAAEALHDAQANWEFIGLGLGVDKDELDSIDRTHPRNDKKLLEMLKLWLNAGKDTTWNAIIQVLRKNTVNRDNLADEIKKKHCYTKI